MGKTIGVFSLKGGVGKTSSVVSLGQALADMGKKVCLIDMNLSAPNLGLHLNIINPEKTIHHLLERSMNPEEVIHKVENLDVIPAAMNFRNVVNPLHLRNRIKNLKRKYDVVLIDSSPAMNDETLGAMMASDDLLVVTSPDYATLSTTIKAVKHAKERNANIIGLILNKVHGKNFELSVKDIEDTADTPVMAVVPHDMNMLKAQSDFVPYTSYKSRAEGSEEYKKLAATLIGEKYKPKFRLKNYVRVTPRRHEINRELYYKSVLGK